jgi:hypothetical protein
MAALEIEGKIKVKLARQSGQSAKGSWMKQDFVLEYQDGNYPAEVCFTAFGNDKVAELDKYGIGDAVKVSFNLRAREYNGRWYNDVRVWKLAPAGSQRPAAPAQQNYGQNYAPAGYGAAAPAAPAPGIEDMPADNPENDLPF